MDSSVAAGSGLPLGKRYQGDNRMVLRPLPQWIAYPVIGVLSVVAWAMIILVLLADA
jgi:hypothetical protein